MEAVIPKVRRGLFYDHVMSFLEDMHSASELDLGSMEDVPYKYKYLNFHSISCIATFKRISIAK